MSDRIPPASELGKLPLLDDAAILHRVATVVHGAFRRQAWFLLLDARRTQLPIIIPMDLPMRPGEDPEEEFRRMFQTLGTLEDVAEILVVYERPGPDWATTDDLAWLIGIEDATAHAGLPVHGPFFATDTGIRRWESHHDVRKSDALIRNWANEDDDHPDTGGAAARRARDA